MSIAYLVDGNFYSLSYSALKDDYTRFSMMTDTEFLLKLSEILHFACICCFLKEIPTSVCLSDRGIIHELVHLLHLKDCNGRPLAEVRELFNNQLRLS